MENKVLYNILPNVWYPDIITEISDTILRWIGAYLKKKSIIERQRK